MAPAGLDQQAVESIDMRIRTTFSVEEPLALGAMDLSLRGILVEIPEKRFQIRGQIDRVRDVGIDVTAKRRSRCAGVPIRLDAGPELHIVQALPMGYLFKFA